MPIIYSRLLKADYLVSNSAIFPLMVRGACAYMGVPYSQDAVMFCATRPEILDQLEMTEDTALDEILRGFGTDSSAAPVMDDLIVTAVQQYAASNNE